jgi:phospholipase/carboxylesterase
MQIERYEAAGIKCVAVVPDQPGDYPLVVLLHGWGDWGESYIDIGEMLCEEKYRFVFPTGPEEVPGAMNGWFMLDPSFRNFAKRAAKARPMFNKLMDALLEHYQTPASRTVIGGFSQGGMMTLEAGLRYKSKTGERVAALIALSSLLPADDEATLPELNQAIAELAQAKTPVFVAHGVYDQVIPVQAGRVSQQILNEAGVPVEYFEFPGYHEMSMDELKQIKNFLSHNL